MIALHIETDDAMAVIAGASELQVLALVLGCNPQADLMNPMRARRGLPPQVVFDLSVTGMLASASGAQGQPVQWIESTPLRAGQTVTVTVIDTARADAALPARPAVTPGKTEQEHFEHCKRIYFELKTKYDTPGS